MDKEKSDKKKKVAGNPDEILERLKSGENPATSLMNSFRGKLDILIKRTVFADGVINETRTASLEEFDELTDEEFEELTELVELED